MGPCVAGGAYLPALSDIIVMVEGTSFMGLGGANLVKGATGQTIDNETLGGARTHNEISGVAHYRVEDDEACLSKIREIVSDLPSNPQALVSITEGREAARPAFASRARRPARGCRPPVFPSRMIRANGCAARRAMRCRRSQPGARACAPWRRIHLSTW